MSNRFVSFRSCAEFVDSNRFVSFVVLPSRLLCVDSNRFVRGAEEMFGYLVAMENMLESSHWVEVSGGGYIYIYIIVCQGDKI